MISSKDLAASSATELALHDPALGRSARAGASSLDAELLDLGDALCELDAGYRVVRVNARQEAISRTPRAASVGRVLWDVWPEAARPESRYWAEYHRCMELRVPVEFEEYYAPLDLWTAITAYPISTGGIAIFSRDVTAQKRVQAALRESEAGAQARAALVEAVLDCVADGVIVYDRQGRTLRSSPAADAILRVPASDRQAPLAERVMRQYEICTEDGRRIGADEMVAIRAAVRGDTIRGVIQRVRSGDHEPRWLLMSAMPLLVAGKHEGAVLSMTDITERKRAEAELAEVTRLYAVLTRVNEAIVRTRDEPSLYAEVCRIVADDSGFPLVWVGLVRGRDVVPAASAGSAAAYVGEVRVSVDGPLGQGPTGTSIRERRPVINDDFALNPSTGPWREATARHGLRASAAFPLHREGAVIGAITFYAATAGAFTAQQVQLLESLCADVSYALNAIARERLRAEAEAALRASEQALRDVDRRKDEFLATLSHELRNPLAPIRNSTYILQHTAPGSDQARRAQNVIQRQTEHLTRLVDDLLDVTRIARGKIELQRARLDVREVVRRTCDDHRSSLDAHGLTLRVEMLRPAWIDADETRLAQVVGNLLQNAAKFGREGGAVDVSAGAADGCAEIRVRDDGGGIAPDLLPRIFDPFVQGDGGLARTKGGLGLGLALVKGLVELHGGSVRARSDGPGRGSEFVLSFPLVEPPPRAAGARDRGLAVRAVTVLVVEDNLDAAQSIAEVLEMEGHRVHVATDGRSGIAKAQALRPDVVLCDIGLPDVDGYEVARALRGDPGLPALRLIALSGYAQAEDRRRAEEAGFDEHVAKPPSLEVLLASVARAAEP